MPSRRSSKCELPSCAISRRGPPAGLVRPRQTFARQRQCGRAAGKPPRIPGTAASITIVGDPSAGPIRIAIANAKTAQLECGCYLDAREGHHRRRRVAAVDRADPRRRQPAARDAEPLMRERPGTDPCCSSTSGGLASPKMINRAFEKFDRAAVLGRRAVKPEAMIGRAEIGARDHVAPDRRVGDEHLAPVRSLLPDYGFPARVTHCCSTRATCAARPTMKAL